MRARPATPSLRPSERPAPPNLSARPLFALLLSPPRQERERVGQEQAGRQRHPRRVHGRLPRWCGRARPAALRLHRQAGGAQRLGALHAARALLQRDQRRRARRQRPGLPGVHDRARRRALLLRVDAHRQRGLPPPQERDQEEVRRGRVQCRRRGRLRAQHHGRGRGPRASHGRHQGLGARRHLQDRHGRGRKRVPRRRDGQGQVALVRPQEEADAERRLGSADGRAAAEGVRVLLRQVSARRRRGRGREGRAR